MRKVLTAMILALAVAISGSVLRVRAQASTDCQFPDFSSISGLRLIGTAAQADTRLRLISSDEHSVAGAVYCESKQPVARGFDTTFAFQISDTVACCGRPAGGDGFAFIIQNSAPDALGAAGGGMGYAQIADSLVVEFDTFANDAPFAGEFGDPNDNHVSVHTNGAGPNSANESASLGRSVDIPPLKDGSVHEVVVQYEPGSLRVYVDDRTRPAVTAAVDLSETLQLDSGSAWIGFTSANGSASETNELLSWTTAFRDPVVAALNWSAPDTSVAGPPQNLTAQLVSSVVQQTAAAPAGLGGAAQTQDAVLMGYNVYTSRSPNVQPTPANLFTSVPPTQTSTTAPIAPGGSFFIITATYDTGESAPSNEAGAGQPGASISKVKVKSTKLVARGAGFTTNVLVLVDGIPFAAPPVVKKAAKVVQPSTLVTGETLAQYVEAHGSVEIAFINSDQSITRVRYPTP